MLGAEIRIGEEPRAEAWVWDFAAKRVGELELRIPVPCRAFEDMPVSTGYVLKTIRMTMREWNETDKVIKTQLSGDLKAENFRSSLSQSVNRTWPENTPDHYVMRQVIPYAASTYNMSCRKQEARTWRGYAWLMMTRTVWKSSLIFLASDAAYDFPFCRSFLTHSFQLLSLGLSELTGSTPCLRDGSGLSDLTIRITKQCAIWSLAYHLYRRTPPALCVGSLKLCRQDDPLERGYDVKRAPLDTTLSPKKEYPKPGEVFQDTSVTGSIETGKNAGKSDGDVRRRLGEQPGCVLGIGSSRYKAIVGRTANDGEEKKIVGALVGPVSEEPNVYADTEGNVRIGKERRIDEKQHMPDLTKEDKSHIAALVDALIAGPFSEKRVREWCVDHPLAKMCKSGKWSDKRWDDAFKRAIDVDYFPDPTVQVKLEPMPYGKAPRLLLADGDIGQVISALSIKCVEDCMKSWFKGQHIKGKAKRDILNEVFKGIGISQKERVALGFDGQCSASLGDGSAFDTCCTYPLRSIIENRVVWHVVGILSDQGLLPFFHEKALTAHIEKLKLKIRVKDSPKFKVQKIAINSIRRSGDRGTSILNWLTNYTLTHVAFFGADAHKFVWRNNGRIHTDVVGKKRFMGSAYEGDDASANVAPKICDDLKKKVQDFWYRAGHNYKLDVSENGGEFVGVRVAWSKDGPDVTTWMPDLKRRLKNSGVSCSVSAIEGAKKNDVKTLKNIAASKMMSNAYDFAGFVPSVSRKYLEEAQKLGNFVADGAESHELLMKHGEVFEGIAQRIADLNSGVTDQDEMKLLKAVGFGASLEEINKFCNYPWVDFMDYENFRLSLPESWRP